MKMRKLVIGLALASTALAAPAAARDGQWYVSAEGGVMIVEDVDFDVDGGTKNASTDQATGFDLGAGVGYDFGAFRLETEASYRDSDVDSFTAGTQGVPIEPGRTDPGQFPTEGDINILSFMLNGLLDFGPDDGLQGFVGGGAGIARVDAGITAFSTGPGIVNDSDTGFAWQVLAGVRTPLSDNWDVGLKYRYFQASSVDLVDVLGRSMSGDVTTHSLLATLTYNFGGEAPPPPPPPPPPPDRKSTRLNSSHSQISYA